MTELTPTAEELARDLVADLTVCDAATEGPWTAGPHCGDPDGRYSVETPRGFASYYSQPFNGIFIAAAREGWPAAIRCCLAARAALTALNEELSKVIKEREQVQMHLQGVQKGNELLLKGMGSQCELQDAMKQEKRCLEAALRDLLDACRHNRDSVGERVLDAMDRAEQALLGKS